MDQRHSEAYNNDAGNGLLQQYSQGYNTSDNIFTHPNDSIDASWGVNASHYPQPSRAVYQHEGEWAAQQQHFNVNVNIHNNDRQSPLASNAAYNGSTFNNYNPAYTYQQQQYDPSLLQSTQPFKQPQHSPYGTTMTIAPQSLQQQQQQPLHQPQQQQQPQQQHQQRLSPPAYVDEAALKKAIPASTPYNMFSVIDLNQLMRATNTQKLGPFATIAKTPVDYNISRAAIPQYIPRQSKNALKRLAGQDSEMLARIDHRDAKKQRVAARKAKAASRPMKTASDVVGTSARLDSEDLTDDDSDSSDTDSEQSPLPSKRPDTPKGAIEYDTIQALWRSKHKSIDAADVRKGLVDFWELVKTVRDRWKLDAAAVTQAKEKNLKGEIPLLEQRVKDQRDMIETAFKTAFKHGNRTIVETLSENTPLLFLCYQFLLDRLRDNNDYNGSLSRAILEVMSVFSSITDEKLEKTHLVKVMPRFIKNGDAKTQFWTKQILNKAKQNSEAAKKKEGKPDSAKPAEKDTDTIAVAVKKATTTNSAAALPTPAVKKRPLENDDGKPAAKKPATSNGAVSVVKPVEATKPKAPAASKLTTGLFAGLQSAAKKPNTSLKTSTSNAAQAAKPSPTVTKSGTPVAPQAASKPAFSFTQTMQDLVKSKEELPAPKVVEKDLPDETPQEKARRLRREKRGPLRVHWRSAEELEQVRVFVHDPEEETGHDSSQTRDVGDLQGEGRMFKQQHNKMDLDEEEDEIEIKVIDWYRPGEINFADVPQAEQDRNYTPYGGGKLQPESAENVERKKYEDSTLMVFYSHSDDIPATPREPAEVESGQKVDVTAFGAVENRYIDRAAKIRAARQPTKPLDFDVLRNVLSQSGAPPAAPVLQGPTTTPDLSALIAQLAQSKTPQAAAPIMPDFSAGNPALSNFLPQAPAVPTINGVPNIAAIIAQLNNNGVPAPSVQLPLPPPFAMPPPPAGLDPGFAQFLAQRGIQAQPAAPTGSMYENPERRRLRDEGTSDAEPGKQHPNYKTKICKYWQEGKCTKGDNCTYRHG